MAEVYKYLHPDRSDFFEHLLLRCTSPWDLNDPYECLPAFESDIESYFLQYRDALLDNEELRQMLRYSKKRYYAHVESLIKREIKQAENNKDGFIHEFHENYRELLCQDIPIGIISLSLTCESSVMWAHYCNNHHGFVVGLEGNHGFFQNKYGNKESTDSLRKVVYSDNRARIKPGYPDFTLVDGERLDFLRRKSTDWSYEQEVRSFKFLKNRTLESSVGDKVIHLFKVPEDAVTSVILGISITSKARDRIFSAIKANEGLRHVKVYQAETCRSTFKILKRRIEVPK